MRKINKHSLFRRHLSLVLSAVMMMSVFAPLHRAAAQRDELIALGSSEEAREESLYQGSHEAPLATPVSDEATQPVQDADTPQPVQDTQAQPPHALTSAALRQVQVSVVVTSLTSTNAASYVTNSDNSSQLRIVGQYSVQEDTKGTQVVLELTNRGRDYFLAPSLDPAQGQITLPSGATDLHVSVEGARIRVYFMVSGNQGSAGSFTVNFPFDHENYDGWAAKGTTIATVTSTAFDPDLIGPSKTLNVVSSTSDTRAVGLSRVPGGDMPIGKTSALQFSFEDERHSAINPTKWRNEPGTDLKLTLEYPVGAVLAGPTFAGNSAVGQDDGNGKIVFQMGTANASGHIVDGWSTIDLVDGRYAIVLRDMTIAFPASTFAVGQTITLKWYAEYTLAGQTQVTKKETTLSFKLTSDLIHMKPDAFSVGGFTPYVSIGNLAASSELSSIYGVENQGSEPIPNTCVTIYNDKGDHKANFSVFYLYNYGAFFKYQLVFTIKSANGGADRGQVTVYVDKAGALGSYRAYNSKDLNLAIGEYIEKVEVYPLNNPNDTVAQLTNGTAQPIRALPYGARADFGISYRSWVDALFPNRVTPVVHNDTSVLTAKLTWDYESLPLTHKTATVSGNTWTQTKSGSSAQTVHYGLNAPFPVTSYVWERNQSGDLAPGAEVDAVISVYNSLYGASDNWVDPVVLLLPPDMFEVLPGQTPTIYKAGVNKGNATIEETTTPDGKRMYKVVFPSMTIGRSQNSSTAVHTFTIKLRIKPGTPVGTYFLAKTDGTQYPDRAGLMFGTSRIPNNLIYAEGTANKFYADVLDYDGNVQTDRLQLPTKVESITIARSRDMVVTSLLKNSQAGAGAAAWQNVNTPGAQATVPLNGTGSFMLQILNQGNTYIGDVHVIDSLPYRGDSKGSLWDAKLADLKVRVLNANGEDVTISEGYDNAYSLEFCTTGDPSYTGGGITKAGGTAFSNNATMQTAQSFLFKMAGKRLPGGYKIEILGSIKAPATANEYDIDQAAYNVFTANAVFYDETDSTSGLGAGAFTPTKQKFVLTDSGSSAFLKQGIVFKDINLNGVYDDATDLPYAGVTVDLYAEDPFNLGTLAQTPLKTTTTDQNGQYTFTALPGGNYFFKFVNPDSSKYAFVAQGMATDALASHVSQASGFSTKLTVMAGASVNAAVNAGINAPSGVSIELRLGEATGNLLGAYALNDLQLPASGTVAPTAEIPDGYHLKTGTPAEQDYRLTWESPKATLLFLLEADGETPTPTPTPDPTPAPEPTTPTPTPTPNPTPTPSPKPSSTPAPTTPVDDAGVPGAPGGSQPPLPSPADTTTDLPDTGPPTGAMPVWALLNLLLVICGLIASVYMALTTFRRKQPQRAGATDEQTRSRERTRKTFRVGVIVFGLLSLLAFVLTENMANPMVFTDRWTWLMAAIAAIQAVLLVAGRKRKEQAQTYQQ